VIPLAIRFDPTAEPATEQPRSGGIAGWLRELFRPEPADARRQRIEAEAAAELERATRQPQHQ
jgi:hypothetical protein